MANRHKFFSCLLLVVILFVSGNLLASEQQLWFGKVCDNTPANYHIPLIFEAAPSFTAESTQGPVNFPGDFKGSWVILFSHAADFTPVCTTEYFVLGDMQSDFAALNTKIVGLSFDSIYTHFAWLKAISDKITFDDKNIKTTQVNFPVIADVKMDVAKKYVMLQQTSSETKPVSSVYFIDPTGIVRAMMFYPSSVGRNFDEVKRMLIALQMADKFSVATPVNWQPGDDVIVPPTVGAPPAPPAKGTVGTDLSASTSKCQEWFMCTKPYPGDSSLIPTSTNTKSPPANLPLAKPFEKPDAKLEVKPETKPEPTTPILNTPGTLKPAIPTTGKPVEPAPAVKAPEPATTQPVTKPIEEKDIAPKTPSAVVTPPALPTVVPSTITPLNSPGGNTGVETTSPTAPKPTDQSAK